MISEKQNNINYILELDRTINILQDKKREVLLNFNNADVGSVFLSKTHKKIVTIMSHKSTKRYRQLQRIQEIFDIHY